MRAPRPARRTRSWPAWVLPTLAFVCGALVSAAVFTIGWRHQTQQNAAAASALADGDGAEPPLADSLAAARAQDRAASSRSRRRRAASLKAARASAATIAAQANAAQSAAAVSLEQRDDDGVDAAAKIATRAEDADDVSHDDTDAAARRRLHRQPGRVPRPAGRLAADRMAGRRRPRRRTSTPRSGSSSRSRRNSPPRSKRPEKVRK